MPLAMDVESAGIWGAGTAMVYTFSLRLLYLPKIVMVEIRINK
jgi:hypothetical protein